MPRRYSTCTPCWPAFTRSATEGVAYFCVRSSSTKREADIVARQLQLIAGVRPLIATLREFGPERRRRREAAHARPRRHRAPCRRRQTSPRRDEHEADRPARGQLGGRQPFERRERARCGRCCDAHGASTVDASPSPLPRPTSQVQPSRIRRQPGLPRRLAPLPARPPWRRAAPRRRGDASCSPSMPSACAADVRWTVRPGPSPTTSDDAAPDTALDTSRRQSARRPCGPRWARSCSRAAAAPRKRRSSWPPVPAATARDACACRRAAPAAALRSVSGAPCGRPAPGHDRRRTCKRCRAGAARTRPAARPRRGRGRHRRTRDRGAGATPATRRPGASSRRRASRRRPTGPDSRSARRAPVRAAARRGGARSSHVSAVAGSRMAGRMVPNVIGMRAAAGCAAGAPCDGRRASARHRRAAPAMPGR